MVVEYYLGGCLGNGMWSSVVGWNFGTVETQAVSHRHLKIESTDGRKIDSITTTTNRYAGRDHLSPKFDSFKHGCCRASRLNDIDH